MAKSPAEGLMTCPECGYEHAEIKSAKSGFKYRYCPDCNAQYFTRNQQASDRLAAKNTQKSAVTVSDTKPLEAVTKPTPKTGGFSLGNL